MLSTPGALIWESNSTYLYANLLQRFVVFLNPKGTADTQPHALLHPLESKTVFTARVQNTKPGPKHHMEQVVMEPGNAADY